MIESKDSSGESLISYLSFVHVAGCESEPVTATRQTDSMLKRPTNDDNRSLLNLNYVVHGLSKGKKDIQFCNSILTNLLQESLAGKSNTAIICNITECAVDETMGTLK